MSRKKLIITGAVLAVVVLIGGLLAYFTDTTNPKSNVFTVGDKVDIELRETWNPGDGTGIAPGETKQKVPTIENVGANDAYVFMKVVVPKYYDGTNWVEAFSYTTNSGWSEVASNTTSANGTSTSSVYVYAYATAANEAMTTLAKKTGSEGPKTAALFDEVTYLPGKTQNFDFNKVENYSAEQSSGTAEVKSSLNLDLTGYAIQTTGLTIANSETAATTAQQIYTILTSPVADGGLGSII